MDGPASRTYYESLRSALLGELKDMGRSSLLDWLIREQPERTDYLTLAALKEIYGVLVMGDDLADVTAHIPRVSGRMENVKWDQYQLRGVHLTEQFWERALVTASVARQVFEARNSCVTPSADRTQQQELEEYRDALELAMRDNTELRESQDRLEQLLMTLQTENSELRQREQQRGEQARLAADAAREVQRSEDAFSSHMAGRMEEHRLLRLEADEESARRFDARAAEYDQVRREMSDGIRRMQAQMEERLYQWQSDLFAADYRMLASGYAAMYDLAEHRMNQLLTTALNCAAPHPVTDGLQEMAQLLRMQLSRMENTLQLLGLQVLRPDCGDEYDERLHMRTGVISARDASMAGAKVAKCIVPGVIRRRTGAEDEVLMRAEVALQGSEA